MAASPLILGETQRADLAALRAKAMAEPINTNVVLAHTVTPAGMRAHMKRMEEFTIILPTAFVLTFTLEERPKAGLCRHMSLSVLRRRRAPSPEAVWMVAEELGFWGSLEQCSVWLEDIGQGDKAVNVVQPIANEDELARGRETAAMTSDDNQDPFHDGEESPHDGQPGPHGIQPRPRDDDPPPEGTITFDPHTLPGPFSGTFQFNEQPWFPFSITIGDVTIALLADGKWEGSIEGLRAALATGKSYGVDGHMLALLWLILREMERDKRFW
jgi:hypothetical protein